MNSLVLWHPAVHAYYGESLYFYFIKANRFSREWAQSIKEMALFGRVRRGTCVYPILGPYDLLLRIWMTDSSRKDFETGLRERGECKRADIFFCTDIQYLWFNHGVSRAETINPSSIAQFDIRTLLDAQREKGNAAYGRLVTAGLVLDRDKVYREHADRLSQAELTKFYTIVRYDRTRPKMETVRVVRAFLERERLETKRVHLVTLYVGLGVAGDMLVKGCAAMMADVLDFTMDLCGCDENLGLDSETLVIGRPECECDDLNLDESDAESPRWRARRMGDFFGIERSAVEKARSETQQVLVQAFSDFERAEKLDELLPSAVRPVGGLFAALVKVTRG